MNSPRAVPRDRFVGARVAVVLGAALSEGGTLPDVGSVTGATTALGQVESACCEGGVTGATTSPDSANTSGATAKVAIMESEMSFRINVWR